ncbi:MAG: potassium channel protein [Chloroflexi bacterium]|nr:potassium channel protein [Chloroflexota bacterium]
MWRNVFHTSLGLALLPILLLVAVGTAVYAKLENWSILEALYATIITVTTVGYGDFSPQTPWGRVFAIFFTITAIGLASYAISTLAAVVIEYETTRVQRTIQERRMKKISELHNHTIVCGGNVLAHRVTNEFLRRDEPFIIIEQNEETLKWALLWMHEGYLEKRMHQFRTLDEVDYEIEEQKSLDELADEMGLVYLLEDPTDEQHLRRAGLERAHGVVAAMEDDRDNMAIVLSARDMASRLENPNLRIVARVHNEMNKRRMYLAGADKVVSSNFVGGFQIATHMLTPVVGEFWDTMLFQADNELIRFVDVRVADMPEWSGKTVGHLREQDRLVIAIKRNGRFLYAPISEEKLLNEDILITVYTTGGS